MLICALFIGGVVFVALILRGIDERARARRVLEERYTLPPLTKRGKAKKTRAKKAR